MKYTVDKSEYKKVIKKVEVNIPETPQYFWHNGERVAYCVTPIWTSWNKEHYQKEEEIWEFKVVKIDPSFKLITASDLRLSELGDILRNEKHQFNRLVNNLLFYPDENTRTKERFMTDYNNVLEEIHKNIPLENE
jgi:hypothetical protein